MQTTPQPQLRDLQLRREIRDLGTVDPHLEGILSPGYCDSEVSNHIHEEFLAKADQFLTFCPIDRPLIEHWKGLIRAAIGSYLADGPLTMLDIGSGGGTSVFPMLELLPNARVFAMDLSLPLLAQLRNRAQRDGLADRLTVMQMNAEDVVFSDGQADIIMGANILHHAVSPEQILAEIRRVLKPSGVAVFWELFEGGAQFLAGLFDIWLEMNKHCSESLPPGMENAMLTFIADLDRRKGRTKPAEVLATLDSKWYFTRPFLEDVAGEAGFSRCEIRNVYGAHNVVWQMADHELRRWGFGLDGAPLWAREKLLAIQGRFSDDYLDENPFSCSIVMRP